MAAGDNWSTYVIKAIVPLGTGDNELYIPTHIILHDAEKRQASKSLQEQTNFPY